MGVSRLLSPHNLSVISRVIILLVSQTRTLLRTKRSAINDLKKMVLSQPNLKTKSTITYQRVFLIICDPRQTFPLSSLLSLLLLDLSDIFFYHSQTSYFSPHATRGNLKILLFYFAELSSSLIFRQCRGYCRFANQNVPSKHFLKLATVSSWEFLCSVEDTMIRF